MIGGLHRDLSVDYGLEQSTRPETDRVVRGKARFLGGRGDRGPRLVLVEMGCVERETGDAGRSQRQRDPLVELDQLAQAGNRRARIALDLARAGPVAEDERVWRRAVNQAERDAAVGGVHERALALDEEQLAAPVVALDDQPLCCAGEEVRRAGSG